MKVFNVIKKVILILSYVLLGVCFVLAGITLDQNDTAISTGLLMFVVPAFIGFFLFGSENKIANRIGMGLTTAAMLIQLFFALTKLENSTAAIIGLCSVVLYVIYFIVVFVGYLAMGDKADNDPERIQESERFLDGRSYRKRVSFPKKSLKRNVLPFLDSRRRMITSNFIFVI